MLFAAQPSSAYFLILNTTKMKAKVLILVLLVAAGLAMTSCASSKGGCKQTRDFVGYR